MTNAAQYVMLNFGHHTLRWHLAQIRAGRSTAEQIACYYQPNPKDPEQRTICKGLADLLKAKSEDLPESLR
jgi:hypothetical protein